MTALLKGKLCHEWLENEIEDGDFVRDDSIYRNWVTPDGAPGPTGSGGFKAQAGRYHLYTAYACPWAHRTMIFRQLKQLPSLIGLSIVEPDMLQQGWSFAPTEQGSADAVNGFRYVHQLYTLTDPNCTSQVTVPILWDKHNQVIVNNESSEIIRMFNTAFNGLTGDTTDYYPKALRQEIEAVNAIVYDNINNGVYRCGFATTQTAYEAAFDRLFAALDDMEARLHRQRYLTGAQLTEADWRLFTTLIRFDAVYVGHFKCNLRRIRDYPNLYNFLKELYQMPGIAQTLDFTDIKRHYYFSHTSVNPTQIVPKGPTQQLLDAHDRDRSYDV